MPSKKSTVVKPFFFKDHSNEEVLKDLDNYKPIKLSYNEDLLERIYKRYPYLKKKEINLIVRSAFFTIREILLLGNIINFNGLMFDTKMHFIRKKIPQIKVSKTKIGTFIKVHLGTPPSMK